MAVKFLDSITIDGDVGIGTTRPTVKLDVNGTVRFRGGTTVDKAFQAESYVSSPSGPFPPQPGINAIAVIPVKTHGYQLTLTFASGLLIDYRCEGENCPKQPG